VRALERGGGAEGCCGTAKTFIDDEGRLMLCEGGEFSFREVRGPGARAVAERVI
jgi:hypothetical protein